MIELVKHLPGVGEDVQRLSGLIRQACETETDPGVRAHLQGLNALMEHAFGKVKETLPAAEQDLNKSIADITATTTRVPKEIEEVEKRLAEADKALAQVATPPAARAFDPRLGTQLRDDLLKRFGPAAPKAGAGRVDAGDVAEMESRAFSVSPISVTMPPSPPPPPSPPKTEDDWPTDS